MIERVKNFIFFVIDEIITFVKLRKSTKLFYLSTIRHKNLGDNINKELFSKILGSKVTKLPYTLTFIFPHYFFIGSILRYSNKSSTIIGSGFNSPKDIDSYNNLSKIIFLRGNLSSMLIYN